MMERAARMGSTTIMATALKVVSGGRGIVGLLG